MRRALSAAAVFALVGFVAAGCGGGGKKANTLTKHQYAAALNKLCLSGADQIRELHLDVTIDSWKADGDAVVRIDQHFLNRFDALTPPGELKDAAARFRDANEKVLADDEGAVTAAKNGDAAKLQAAIAKANSDNSLERNPAKEIGARDC